MSFLNITYKGKKATIHLDDGKSDILDRYVDLDKGTMYYTMGKQISGKPINPNGKTGREILQIAEYWANNPDTKWSNTIFSGKGESGCFIATAAFGTPFQREVAILCAFRDHILASSSLGKLFIRSYYILSPRVAALIVKCPFVSSFIRYCLSIFSKYSLVLLKRYCSKFN